jgi:hypothetical protein
VIPPETLGTIKSGVLPVLSRFIASASGSTVSLTPCFFSILAFAS